MQKQSKFNLFIYQSGVEFSSKSNEIGLNAVSLVSFMQIRLKNPFLQLNIFATVGESIRPKYSTISNFSLLYWKMAKNGNLEKRKQLQVYYRWWRDNLMSYNSIKARSKNYKIEWLIDWSIDKMKRTTMMTTATMATAMTMTATFGHSLNSCIFLVKCSQDRGPS